jgi:ammonium transporter, Amt family
MTLVLSTFVAPTAMHWVWSNKGWLSATNQNSVGGLFVIDFAGSGVVHLVGGVAALQAARAVGPRLRPPRFDKDGVREIPGSNASLSVLGTLILWFCWCVFDLIRCRGVDSEDPELWRLSH